MKPSIGIAGAGLCGRLLAWQLMQKGCQVTLFDSDERRGEHSCAFTAAGILTPFSISETVHPFILERGLQSLKLWPEILITLPQPVFFQQAGSLLLAHRQDAAEMDRVIQISKEKISTDSMRELNGFEIKQLEPELTINTNKGIYLRDDGNIDNITLLAVLEKALLAQGVIWHSKKTVAHLEAGKIVLIDKTEHAFDWVFDCRGLGAKEFYKNLRGVRGELVWLHAPDINLTRPIRLLHPRYHCYVVPRPNNIYVVGASEIESDDQSPISVRTLLELLSAIYSLHAAFAEARVIKTLTNCRPAFPDHLPKVTYEEKITRINGLYRYGYLLAPILVKEVVEHLCQRYF